MSHTPNPSGHALIGWFVLILIVVLALSLLSLAPPPATALSPSLLISEVPHDPLGTEPDGEWIEVYSVATDTALLISEVLYDSLGPEPDGEWIEIYSVATGTVTLSNYKVGDEEERGGSEGMLQFPEAASINPGQVIVVANKATAFLDAWGFPPDYEMVDSDEVVPDMIPYTEWASGRVELSNTGDEVLILDGSDAIVNAMSYGNKTTFLDPSAPDVPAGHSLERVPANVNTDTAKDWMDQASPDPGRVTIPTYPIYLPLVVRNASTP